MDRRSFLTSTIPSSGPGRVEVLPAPPPNGGLGAYAGAWTEGFIKVFTQIHTFQNKGAFEGWIRRIIVHTCINFLKKHKKFNESVDLAYANSLQVKEETIPSIMQARQIVECIRLLPIGYRTVLNLYALEGYSHKEIGEMLDIEESTSRSQYTRSKAMLEMILIRKKIIEKPKEEFNWLAALKNK